MKHEINWTDQPLTEAKKAVWLTDLHLDACQEGQLEHFFADVQAEQPDFLLIGGDICNGKNCLERIVEIQQLQNKPLYFVLGNHDFYYYSIVEVRTLAEALSKEQEQIHYLTCCGVFPLSEDVGLIGHDGWADGRVGDFLLSSVVLNDYLLIEELSNISFGERLDKLHALGNEAANNVQDKLREAFKRFSKVILLTHVPPYREACLYRGQISDDNWAPHFVSQIMGETITRVMQLFPDKELLVLCGHSHCAADVAILPNVRVLAGQSILGSPSIQGIVSF